MKLKNLSFFFLLFVTTSSVYGSNILRRADISFTGGFSQPLGGFANSGFSNINLSDNTFNFDGATMGTNYGVNLNFYFINDYVGLSLLFNFNTYGRNLDLFDNKALPAMDLEWTPTYVDNWSQFSALVGLSFRYPLTRRFLLTSRLAVGYGNLLSPYYKAESKARYGTYTNILFSNHASAFAFDGGVGLKFILFSGGVHFNLNMDYMGATNFNFKLDSQTAFKAGEESTVLTNSSYKVKQKFGALNYNAGISFCF